MKANSTGLGSSGDFSHGRRLPNGRGRRTGRRRAARPVPHGQPLARRHRVVLRAAVVGVEELLEPLQELKVILEPTLHQSVNGYYLRKKKMEVKKKKEMYYELWAICRESCDDT